MSHTKMHNTRFIENAMNPMLLYLTTVFVIISCNKNDDPHSFDTFPLSNFSADVAVKWADMTLYTMRFSSFNSPTYASRSLGYLGLAMYESIVNGNPLQQSMNGQLNGLAVPLPEKYKGYQWPLVLNAAEDTLLKLLYPAPGNSHRFIHDKIDELYRQVYNKHAKTVPAVMADRSVKFGQAIALAIYQWSLTDGGDKGYTRNFDYSYVFPSGPSYWIQPVRGQIVSSYPLHPHWGNNRTFVTANSNISIPSIVPFSTDTSSAYYKLYKAVYDKDHSLTQEEMEIAAWWGDDPTETFSPPGHSYYITSLAVKKSNASLMKAAEAYARTGMAVADAFINCWKTKVIYFNERPSSYVKKYIQSDWVQFWPEPPFPCISIRPLNTGCCCRSCFN
jgi:hypothetical protein